MKEPTDILPKIPEYRDIAYSADFVCPECEQSGVGITGESSQKPSLIGWCETSYGYMVILECPLCFTKYRFHGAMNKYDFQAFNDDIYRYFISGGYSGLAWVSNAVELYNKMKGDEQ